MRVWIEIYLTILTFTGAEFHPLMRVWIEIKTNAFNEYKRKVSPSYEGVD